MPKMKKTAPLAPHGMYDIIPSDQKYWRYALKKIESLLEDYSFERIETPLVEGFDLITDAAGSAADVVEREVLTVRARDGQVLAIRPDSAIAIMRAYLEHGMNAQPHPVRLSFFQPVIRMPVGDHDKPRQFHQIGVQTIGDTSEAVDAELLFLGCKILDALGFSNYTVTVNTMGDAACRPGYLRALRDFYKTRQKRLCAKCRNNLKVNMFRLLECAEPECLEIAKDIPQIIDFLDQECKLHFRRVLEFLDEAKIPYLLNPQLVRPYDYMNRTVFEFVPDVAAQGSGLPAGQAGALISGGRYDRLAELIGGPRVPAAGWSLDLSRIVASLKERNVNVPEIGIKPKVFLVQLGEAAKRKSLLLFEDIRKAGIEIKYSLSRDNIKAQLRIAARLGVRFALIFGQKEALEQTVILRETATGVQETIPLEKIIDELKKRLKK